VPKTGLMRDKDFAGAELVPVGASRRRVGDPLPGRRLHQLAQHNHKRSSACGRTLTRMRLLWQLIGTLLVVGFVLAYWWIIALVILGVLAIKFGPGLYRRYQASVAAEQRRLAELGARADQQHQWRMAGDDRGVFGLYPPAAI
jgi:hypothetical protein